jgi:hypothetical protein
MWQPDPGWQPLPGGMGTSTTGVWLAEDGDRQLVVKRISAPLPGDPGELSDRRHFAWWRRPVEVAASRVVEDTPGLHGKPVVRIDEDEAGATLWHEHVPAGDLPGPFVARALGRFAGAELSNRDWLARGQLADRLARIEHGGGWRTLERTTVADVADRLWQRRGRYLAALGALPQVPQHGDPVPGNLPGRDGDDVIAVDWSTLGIGPVGGDLGYWSLQAREEFEVLLEAYAEGLPPGISVDDARLGAQVTAVYTALSRAEWALARVAATPGALAAKYRHPSVAPYLRSLQRQFPQIEALI